MPKGKYIRTEEMKKKISARTRLAMQSKEIRLKMKLAQEGAKSHRWKGGRQSKAGYTLIYSPNHPYNTQKYVAEHRLVMEKYLGRVLLPTEIVHHINGIRNDNRIENLMRFSNNHEHIQEHNKMKGKSK